MKVARSLLLKLFIFCWATNRVGQAGGQHHLFSGDGVNAFEADGYNGTSHIVMASVNHRSDRANLAAMSVSPTRIIGGYRISISATPWQVAIYENGAFTCGGSIVARRWIMTAAHCATYGRSYRIRAGSSNLHSGGQVRHVERVFRNPKFRESTMNHDVALFKLREPFRYNRSVQPVRLPKPNLRTRPRRYRIAGWGVQRVNAQSPARRLRAANVNYISKRRCRNQYSPLVITRYMLCAATPGRDSCSGDSGGCLTSDGICFGIVSFGYGCARPRYPGVYTDVALQMRWIERVIRNF